MARYDREEYRRKREAGICTICGKVPALPNRAICQACTERQRKYNSTAYKLARQKAKGQIAPITKREKWQGCSETCPDYCPYSECLRPSAMCPSMEITKLIEKKPKPSKTAVKQGSLHADWKKY